VGLDLVNLVLAVEDEFDVYVGDDWNDIRTVDDLLLAICSQIADQKQLQASGTCPSLKPFFKTRDAIYSLTPSPRRSVRPRSLLQTLIPRSGRRTVWEQLQSRTSIDLPPLVLPGHVSSAVQTIICVLLLTIIFFLIAAIGSAGLVLAFCISIILVPLAYFSTRPFAAAFPENCQTVRDLVRHARPPIYPTQRSSPIIDQPNDVWKKLVAIVSDQLDVPVSEVTPHARFVEDLKCD